jgi:hypothetical protein
MHRIVALGDERVDRGRRGAAGFSLIEVTIALAVTLAIMATLYMVTRSSALLYEVQSHAIERGLSGLRALDDMALEIARAGLGLGGDVQAVVPALPGAGPTADALTVRSNPEGIVGALQAGLLVHKVREVRFRLTTDAQGAVVLVKDVEGQPRQVLARHVGGLRFEYLDDLGETIAPARVRPGRSLGGVRITLSLLPDPARPPVHVPPLTLVVPLEPQSATVTFDVPRPGFRLRRAFYRMRNAVGVVSRPFSEAGVILAESPAGPNWLYTFPLQRLIRDARIDTVVPLARVRQAAALALAPEEGPWSGSLFVVTGVLRSIQVWRVSPDAFGGISASSEVDLLTETRDMSVLGGAAFGIDGGIYLSDPSAGAIFRYLPGDPDPGRARVEPVAAVPGRPGPLVLGDNGSIYCLAEAPGAEGGGTVLWELAFDPAGAPEPPRRVARLEGAPRSVALDPLTGSLYALLADPLGDTVLLELSRPWLRRPQTPPREAFRLSSWRKEVERTLPEAGDVVIPRNLLPPSLDFVSFDASGALYFGAAKVELVLQAELDRPGGVGLHTLGVAGIVGQEPGLVRKSIRIQAWRKKVFGF